MAVKSHFFLGVLFAEERLENAATESAERAVRPEKGEGHALAGYRGATVVAIVSSSGGANAPELS
jgi:hypothetical protein